VTGDTQKVGMGNEWAAVQSDGATAVPWLGWLEIFRVNFDFDGSRTIKEKVRVVTG
jgi:hypothetical protein